MRGDRLAQALAERELDALVVTTTTNVRWLTGFTGSNGVAVVGAGQRDFITDFRYTDQAAAQVEGFDRIQGERSLVDDAAKRLSGRVGFEDAHLSVRTHGKLAELAEGVELVPAGDLLEELRAVKDPAEVDAIRAAAALADDALEAVVLARGLAGRSEREVALELEAEMRRRGAEDPSFPSIIAAGPHGARPHAEPRDVEIPSGTLVVCDWGARLDGYCSDCTRTLASGPLEGEMEAVYELVRDAQAAAVEAVRPGAACRDVDSVAREPIAAAGHGDRFGHSLGHGVGLEVHEEPRLSQQSEGTLVAGNVVTVEPGVYVSGAFGVRIEDLVAVTGTGCEILSRLPKALTVPGA
ncbi:MAG: Xaa-Pro peptidase family protein [Thermoleophilaceae bacterium]